MYYHGDKGALLHKLLVNLVNNILEVVSMDILNTSCLAVLNKKAETHLTTHRAAQAHDLNI